MMNALKKYIKTHIVNDNHPAAMYLQILRLTRKYNQAQQRHRKMTYAEMEAEISEKFLKTFGRPLNWDNPQTYNEKLNVSKLYMPSELKTRLADKLAVREWISEKIGDEYLIPLLGVYDSFEEINFDALPDKFVIKCSHDSGSYTLVKDKSKMHKRMLRQKYAMFMKRNYGWFQLEMHYRDIKPKIIIEQYMGDSISDYKFTCLNGKPYYCWIDIDRRSNHKRNMYNMDWELQAFNKGEALPNTDYECPRPEKFDEMKRITETLCEGFDQVRVDWYYIDGKIYFGEMTFTGANGFSPFTPDEWDYTLGALWPFDNSIRKKILAEKSKP